MERQRHSADCARQCRTLSAGESQTARMVRSACRTRAGLGSGHTHTDDRPRAANREQHGLTETVEISAGKLAADSSAGNIPRRVAWRVQHARAPLSGEGVCVTTFTICVLHAEDALESHRSHTDGRGFQNPPAWRPPLPCSACRTKWGGMNGRTGTVTIRAALATGARNPMVVGVDRLRSWWEPAAAIVRHAEQSLGSPLGGSHWPVHDLRAEGMAHMRARWEPPRQRRGPSPDAARLSAAEPSRAPRAEHERADVPRASLPLARAIS